MSIRTKIALMVLFFLLVLISSFMVVFADVGSNVFLSNIEIKDQDNNSLSLSPSFLSASMTNTYTLAVAHDVGSITVTPTVLDSLTVTVNGLTPPTPIVLDPGATTTVTVRVEMIIGDQVIARNYTINVTRVSLSGLSVTGGSLIPSRFEADITNYQLAVEYNTDTITVTPVASSSLSITVIGGTPIDDRRGSYSVLLNPGETTTITVTVSGLEGILSQDYNLNVTRVSLSGLSVDPGSLDQTFAADTLVYDVVVDCNVGNITVTPYIDTSSLSIPSIFVGGNPAASGVSCSVSLESLASGEATRVMVTVSLGSTSRIYIITVTIQEDITPPVWDQTMPADETVECNNLPEIPTITASDTCDNDVEVIYNENEVSPEGDCPYNYILTRTWTATDDCENDIQHIQTITVQDTAPPSLIVPQAVTIPCGASTDPSSNNNIEQATATDNCDSDPEVTYSDSVSGTCPSIIIRTWSATDDCGNSVSDSQTITVQDTTPPVLMLPDNVTIGFCESIEPDFTGWATATDNSDSNPLVTYSDSESDNYPLAIIRTWKATDACGNSISYDQTIMLEEQAFLDDIILNEGILQPAFKKWARRQYYQVYVAFEVESINVKPVTANSSLTIKINDEEVSSGNFYTLTPLAVGRNNFKIQVLTTDETSSKTYTVQVLRDAGTDTSRMLTDFAIDPSPFSPAWSQDVKDIANFNGKPTREIPISLQIFDENNQIVRFISTSEVFEYLYHLYGWKGLGEPNLGSPVLPSGVYNIQATTPLQMNWRFGRVGEDSRGILLEPHALAIDSTGNVFIGSKGAIQVFDSLGNFLYFMGPEIPCLDFGVSTSNAMAFNLQGKLMVLQSPYRLLQLEPDGSQGKVVIDFKEEGIKIDWLDNLAIGSDGTIYVSCRKEGKVLVFSSEGILCHEIRVISENAQVPPSKLNSMTVGQDGKIYVTTIELEGSMAIGQVKIFSSDGTLVKKVLNIYGGGPLPILEPGSIGVLSDGSIIVSEGAFLTISQALGGSVLARISPDGELLNSWGEKGSQTDGFSSITRLCVVGNTIYASDHSGNHRVVVMDENGSVLKTFKTPPEKFVEPVEIVRIDTERFVIVDKKLERCTVMRTDGSVESSWKTWNLFQNPGEGLNGLVVGPDDSLYLYRWNEIVSVSPEGQLIRSINLDTGKDSFMPNGCLIDEQGHITLCGRYPGALWVFDRDGHLLQKYEENDEEIRGNSSGKKPSLWAGDCGFFGSVHPSSENGIFVQRLVKNSDGSLDIHVCELDFTTGQIRKDISLDLEFQGEGDFQSPFIVLDEYLVKGNVKVKVGPSSIRKVIAFDWEGNFQWSLGEVPGIDYSLMDLIGEGNDLIMLEKGGSDIRVESWNVNSEISLDICQVEMDNIPPEVIVRQTETDLVTVDEEGFLSLSGEIYEKNFDYYSISYRGKNATHPTWISVLSPQGKRKFTERPREDGILARFSVPRKCRDTGIDIKVIAVDAAGNRSDSEGFIVVDFDDDGDGTGNADDPEPNINNSVKMVLEPLYPDSNSKPSKAMQGGVIYRYYTLKNQSDEPITGARLSYNNFFANNTNHRINITSADNGEVVLEMTTSKRNNVDTYNIGCNIGNIEIDGIEYELMEEPTFPVEILPLTYSTNWVAGNGCSAKGGIGIGAGVFVTGQQAGGMVVSRTLKDPLHQDEDSLGINNNFSNEVGVGVEACLGEGHLGPVKVKGPEASAGVFVGTFNEFASLFDTPENLENNHIGKLEEIYFLLVGVENALSMGSGQLLVEIINLLSSYISDSGHEIKEILQGFSLSINADASLAKFGLDTGKKFTLKGLNLGSIGENYNVSAAIIDYPISSEVGVKISVTLQAGISLVSAIGYEIIGNVDLTHKISLELISSAELNSSDIPSFVFKRAILSVLSPANDEGEIQAINFIIEKDLVLGFVDEIEQFSQILNPSDSDQYSGLVLDQYMVKSILKTIINICSEIKIPYKKVVLMDKPPTTLDIGLGANILGNQVDLGFSPEFGKYNSFTLEEGVFVPVDTVNNIAKFIKYSSYSDSLFSANVDSLLDMMVDLLSVIGEYLADFCNVICDVISDLGETIIEIGADVGGVAIGGAEVIFEGGTDIISGLLSFSPDIEIQKIRLSSCDTKDVGKLLVALPTDCFSMGAVGEFYYLPSIKNDLSKPFLKALKPNNEGKKVTIVSIAPLDNPFIVGGFYSIQPVEKSLSKPAKLNLIYTKKAIKDRDVGKFIIYRFNKEINAWKIIPSMHDKSNQKLTAQITQLGEYCIGYDETPPAFSLLDYSPGEVVLIDSPQLRIKCQDTGSGIDFHFLEAMIDDLAVDIDFNPKLGIAQLNYDFPLDAGDHQFTISGQDTSGNSNTQKFILEIQLPPSPIILEEAIVSDGNIELRFSPSQQGTFPLTQLILRRAEPYKGTIFHVLAILEPKTICFIDEKIEQKTNYAYQVFAEDTNGNMSIFSNIIYAETY